MVQSKDTQTDPTPSEPLLFTPFKTGNVQLKNRICISPMCMSSCEDGFVGDWHLVHLGARAIGGAGVVMVEATAVEPRGRISPGCPGIWKGEHVEPLKRIATFLRSQNCVPAIQLAHAGRKGSLLPSWFGYNKTLPKEEAWTLVAPSPIGEFTVANLMNRIH